MEDKPGPEQLNGFLDFRRLAKLPQPGHESDRVQKSVKSGDPSDQKPPWQPFFE
jgi:hypothetical protein